jgi:hypothetical protein
MLVAVSRSATAAATPGEPGEEAPVEGVELGDPVLGHVDGDLLVLRGGGLDGHVGPSLLLLVLTGASIHK